MMDLREYQKKPARLADYLPWAALVASGVVLNKDGSFQRSFAFRGPDMESATRQELVALTARLNDILRRLGSGWALFVEAERCPASGYPESDFPEPVSWLVDAERKAQFGDMGASFETRMILTLAYMPAEDKGRQAGHFFVEGEGKGATPGPATEALEAFTAKADRLQGLLETIMVEMRPLTDAETLSYLHRTISLKSHDVAVPETPLYLDGLLADTPLRGGLEPMLGDQHLGLVSVLGFPGSTVPGLLDALGTLDFEYRWTSRFLPLDKRAAEKELTKYRRQWFSKRKSIGMLLREIMTGEASPLLDTDADNKAVDVDEALQALGADYASYGYYSSVIVVRDRCPRKLDEKIQAVERTLGGKGFVTLNERAGAVEAWLSSLPGHLYAGVRQPLVSSINLAHMMPFAAMWTGESWNGHLDGPPLLHGFSGQSPFRVSTHVGDVGHTLIVGPTGAGKSVLLNFMALQFRRYGGAQVFVFDKGGSARLTTLATGGQFAALSLEGGLSFQPLARIEEAAERSWATDWLIGLLSHEGLTVTPEMKNHLWLALDNLSAAPKRERTLTGLLLLLQDADIKAALRPYTLEGAFGTLLDGDEDHLTLSTAVTFEMEELMHHSKLALPVLTYLFHRLEDAFTGAPTLLILDEAWLFLDDPLFAARIREWLKTLRKKNVSVVFATQSLSDITESRIAPALIESCLSRIFLPNPRASEPQAADAYRRFGLQDRQISLIASATPKRDYYYQSRLGCRLFELALGPVALAFTAASSKDDHRLIDRLLPANDNHPANDNQPANGNQAPGDQQPSSSPLAATHFACRYLNERNLPWAADLLQDYMKTQATATNSHAEQKNTPAAGSIASEDDI